MSSISIRKISITDLETDAIVNAANDGLWAGGGVCGAVFKAAGHRQLQEACDEIGHCDTGSAVITPGFKLKAKYIIHAVGPRWKDGKHNEPKLLYGAYYRSLELALENGCTSIGFPLISAGIFGYPVHDAWRRAFGACRDFLDQHKDSSIDIVFAVLSDEMIKMGQKTLIQSDASRYKIAERNDWGIEEMPEKHDTFILQRPVTAQQMEVLRRGHIPQEMEDKWFWYMEGDTLFAHRSWTGFCIYRVEFKPDDNHLVTVNRDPEQYSAASNLEDAQKLNNLLNWWSQDTYDYYSEWLAETCSALRKTGKIPQKLMISGREADAYFFYAPEEEYGFMSNWYHSPFDLDGLHFSSVEQYIMYRKCMVFGDETSAQAVLAAEDTAMQQHIGRKTSGYIDAVWAGMRQMVVLRGLMAKFSQNEDLKQKLLNTGDAYLVECSGSDRIWACGVCLNDERRLDASKWNGENILGFALMEVREMLKSIDVTE